MLDIQKKAIEKFEAVLKGANAKYKIILEDGTQYGELEVVEKKEIKRKSPILPVGTYTNHFKPIIEGMVVGQVGIVPFNNLNPETLRGSISSWAVQTWGKGSITTLCNYESNSVEVLRLS